MGLIITCMIIILMPMVIIIAVSKGGDKMKAIVKRNKNKISRAFRLHAYWREKLSTAKGKRCYYRGALGEFVWIY